MVKEMKEKAQKIEIKDMSVWLKIAVIGWLVYLGFIALSILITLVSFIFGIQVPQ